jgi:hypothetical protein
LGPHVAERLRDHLATCPWCPSVPDGVTVNTLVDRNLDACDQGSQGGGSSSFRTP